MSHTQTHSHPTECNETSEIACVLPVAPCFVLVLLSLGVTLNFPWMDGERLACVFVCAHYYYTVTAKDILFFSRCRPMYVCVFNVIAFKWLGATVKWLLVVAKWTFYNILYGGSGNGHYYHHRIRTTQTHRICLLLNKNVRPHTLPCIMRSPIHVHRTLQIQKLVMSELVLVC